LEEGLRYKAAEPHFETAKPTALQRFETKVSQAVHSQANNEA
jgi:hypothetical protein